MMAPRGGSRVHFNGRVDQDIQANIDLLKEHFPRQSTSEIKSLLEVFDGNFYDAFDVLSGSPGPSSRQSTGFASSSSSSLSSSHNDMAAKVKDEDYYYLEDIPNHNTREKVANLLDLVGTSYSMGFILDILGNCNWNVDEAAIILLDDCVMASGEVQENDKPDELNTGRVTTDDSSVTPTSFDPTPPSTPPLPKCQERFPGGVVPGFIYSSKGTPLPTQCQTQQSQRPSLENEKGEQIAALKPSSDAVTTLVNDIDLGVEGNLELMEISEAFHTASGATRRRNGTSDGQQANSSYGFGNETRTAHDELDAKVAILREMLPGATKRRCKVILQLFPDVEEAFENLFEEIAEHGADTSGDETEEDETDSESSEFETVSSVKDRNRRALGSDSPGSSRRGQKRRAETPEQEPPAKKPRVVVEEEHDEEAEAAQLEPAGEWVLKTFGGIDGISIILASGKHPCKFPRGLLCHHFSIFREQLSGETTEIDLPDANRVVFDLLIQLAITKSIQLHESQLKTRSTEITTLMELLILATRLELPGAGYIIAARLKKILLDKRIALQGCHIETAYTLKRGHPIQKIIVQSLGRAYFLLKQSTSSKRAPVYRRGEGDNARRSAFGGDRFIFQDQLDNIVDFAMDLSSQKDDMLQSRNETTTRSGKTRKITYTDPLSEDVFSL